jgi:hypothetical protein
LKIATWVAVVALVVTAAACCIAAAWTYGDGATTSQAFIATALTLGALAFLAGAATTFIPGGSK